MENQPTTNPLGSTSVNSAPVSQSPVPAQVKTNLLVPILLTALVSAIVFGFGGYYFGTRTVTPQQYMNQNQPVPTNSPITTLVQPSPTPQITSNLTKYTSSFEKLSFYYPSDWIKSSPQPQSNDPKGDALGIKDPKGLVEITWISEIDGLGGSCDPNVPFGKEGEMGGACPLYEVINKQKLTNVDLYYVAYISTRDGVNYVPGFALQDSSGLMETKRTMYYPIFNGRNNGKLGVELSGRGIKESTKDEAKNFFITPEALQAKNILLSATY